MGGRRFQRRPVEIEGPSRCPPAKAVPRSGLAAALEASALVQAQRRRIETLFNGAGRLPERITGAGAPIVQRALTEEEKDDKKRVLMDYVQFTPPSEFKDEYYREPDTKLAYKTKLLEKIRGKDHIMRSLKAQKQMRADVEDDNWDDGSLNETTLAVAINEIYKDNLKRKDEERLIGRTDEEFNKHDCVWAAIAYGLGGTTDDLEAERALATTHSSKQGEVEDSILYRLMEKLGWRYLGDGDFDEMFPMPRKSTWTYYANAKGIFDGRYIISEDKNVGGTAGHVLAVDVKDTDIATSETYPFGFKREISFTDRQHERVHDEAARTAKPAYQVYVWKVS